MSRKLLVPAAVLAAVLTLDSNKAGYEDHWYYDNVVHFMSGFILGWILPAGRERETFIALATVWESFEWWSCSNELYEVHPAMPHRAMGTKDWSFDHQVEDTILDTIVGMWGVKLARRLK